MLQCLKCHYPIAQQVPPQCPECGCDLSLNPPGAPAPRALYGRNLAISIIAVPVSMLVYYTAVGMGLGFDFPLSPANTSYALWRGFAAGAVLALALTGILSSASRMKFMWAAITLVMSELLVLLLVYFWTAMVASI